jgi:hypothetical protein
MLKLVLWAPFICVSRAAQYAFAQFLSANEVGARGMLRDREYIGDYCRGQDVVLLRLHGTHIRVLAADI